jgi:hypothetical protein
MILTVFRPKRIKNGKSASVVPVAAELRKLPLSPGKVFAHGLPKMETFKRDLRRAEIEFVDANGRRADFHSLRRTVGTNLALAGTAPRVAMEAIRQSDIRNCWPIQATIAATVNVRYAGSAPATAVKECRQIAHWARRLSAPTRNRRGTTLLCLSCDARFTRATRKAPTAPLFRGAVRFGESHRGKS